MNVLDPEKIQEIAHRIEIDPRELSALILRHGIRPGRRGITLSAICRALVVENRNLRRRAGTPTLSLGQILRGWTR